MTKKEAIQALIKGKKLTQRLFMEGEYIYMKNGIIFSEDGIQHDQFWETRQEDHWENGWEVYG